MKQKIIKTSLIAFVSILIITASVKIIVACGGGDFYYEWRSSFFAPENAKTNNKQETDPLYYSFYQYYKYSDKANNLNDYTNINTREWHKYFNKQVSNKDIEDILYKLKLNEIDQLIFKIKDEKYKISDKISKNTILKFTDKKTAISFLFYIGYAKRCEPYATYHKDYFWQEKNDPRENTAGIEKLIVGGNKLIKYCKSPFIQERYIFQIIRLHYMKKEYAKAISFYDNNKTKLSDISSIKYRALGYKAGAHYKLKEYAKANYLYSIIFDSNVQRRLSAQRSFKPVNEEDWNESLSYAKNKHEKCVLWQMLGIYADPYRAMQEIYKINPSSKTINLLLTRSINIFENENLEDINFYDKKPKLMSGLKINLKQSDNEFIKFVQKVALSNNTNNKLLWNLSASYLSFFSGQTDLVSTFLYQAKKISGNNKLANDQIKLFEILLLLEKNNNPTEKFENTLSVKLNNILFSKQHKDIRKEYATRWICKKISNIYMQNNMPIKAHIANNHTIKNSFLDSSNNCISVINFLEKNNKTKIEQTLAKNYKYSNKDIYKYLAINELLIGNWKKSLVLFKKADNKLHNILNVNPFDISIKDCYDCNSKPTKYTAISMLEEIIKLENESTHNKNKAAENYFKIANACYNNSFFGANRDIYTTRIKYRQHSNIFYDDVYNKPYVSCVLAENYYLKARENSNDIEFMAKCTFMAAKCELNAFYIESQGGSRTKNFIAGKYFKQLKNKYLNTRYYKEIIEECTYFKKFSKK